MTRMELEQLKRTAKLPITHKLLEHIDELRALLSDAGFILREYSSINSVSLADKIDKAII